MANRPAPALVLREGDPERLTRTVRSSSAAAGLAQRSRIVLLAAEGVANETIAERVGVAPNTVLAWRRPYAARGPAGWPMSRARVGQSPPPPAAHGRAICREQRPLMPRPGRSILPVFER